MTPKASADQGGGVEAAAREIVDHCPRCSRLLSRPDSDKRDVYECPGCGRWWQIAALTTQEAIAAALRAAPPDVEQIARGIHERMCTGSPACSWEDISEPGHRATHMETARIALDAVRAAPPSGPHNEVACVSCKQPVGVTALNAIRCGACGGSRAAAADVAVSALHDIMWRQPASTDRDDMNKLIWKIHGLLRDAAPPSGLTPPRPHDAPLNLPADRSARIARAIAADDAEVSVAGAATPPEGGLTPDVERVQAAWVAKLRADLESLIATHVTPPGAGSSFLHVFDAMAALLFLAGTDPPKAQHPSGDVERVVRADALADAVQTFMWCQEQWADEQSGYTAQVLQEAKNGMKAAWRTYYDAYIAPTPPAAPEPGR